MHCKLKYVSVFGEKGEEGKCHHSTKIESQQTLMGQLRLLKISMIHHSKRRLVKMETKSELRPRRNVFIPLVKSKKENFFQDRTKQRFGNMVYIFGIDHSPLSALGLCILI